MTDQKIDAATLAFLGELTALTRRTGLAVKGCGCCSSPRVGVAEDLSWNEDEATYHFTARGDDYRTYYYIFRDGRAEIDPDFEDEAAP